jgi:cytoskeletal protein CcmA (bactofilin family)
MSSDWEITDAGQKRTLVEEGTSFKGSMTSTCPVVVKGRIEGEVEAPALSISRSGAVHGRTKVGQVQCEGEIAGELDADTVQLSGMVSDNTVIRAKTLEVKLTAADDKKMQVTFGSCELAVGAEPTDDGAPGKRGKKKRDDGVPDDGFGG